MNAKSLALRLKNLSEELDELKSRICIKLIKNDFRVIILFVKKLELLVTTNKAMRRQQGSSVSGEITVRNVNEDEYNRLFEFTNTNDWDKAKRD